MTINSYQESGSQILQNSVADFGEAGSRTSADDVQQKGMLLNETDILTTNLMEKICDFANLNRAYKRVKSNKGASGVDNLAISDLGAHIKLHKEQIIKSLLDGTYQPLPVRKVEIPKPNGGVRTLGIPTVLDRLVQQAILQIIEPIFDAEFSTSNYGFRPKRSAHMAVNKAKEYVAEGYEFVVDIDLEKFFDNINHDKLMSKLANRIKDKRLLKIIRRFLQSGMMQNGVVIERLQGTPQGGPLSALLSNIILDELDKELEKRGHKFCRYADDCNIYVKSMKAGQRVYESISRFITQRLKLKVNQDKSSVAKANERKFLGYRIMSDSRLTIAPTTFGRVKDKIRQLTKRNRGVSFKQVVFELNSYLRGWKSYYKLVQTPSILAKLDSYIRRKLRCYILKQKKKFKTIVKFLKQLGISDVNAKKFASSGKGWWRLSRTKVAHQALNMAWFEDQGLIRLT